MHTRRRNANDRAKSGSENSSVSAKGEEGEGERLAICNRILIIRFELRIFSRLKRLLVDNFGENFWKSNYSLIRENGDKSFAF